MHDARAKMSCIRDREDSPQQRWSMPRRRKEVRAISSSSLHVVKVIRGYLSEKLWQQPAKQDLALECPSSRAGS
jgi:hypothetical protein